MGAEIFMLCIENRHFQCIDNTADRIDNASCEKPSERRSGQCMKDLGECQHTQPSHADVDHGNVSVLREMLGINSDSVIRRIEKEFLNEKR